MKKLAIDAEWDSATDDTLSIQVWNEEAGEGLLFLSDSLPDYGIEVSGWRIVRWDFKGADTIASYCQSYWGLEGEYRLLFFFSARDLIEYFGWARFEESISGEEPAVNNRRSISGIIKIGSVSYDIFDLAGWTNQGLLGLSKAVGVEMTSKSSLDEYKTRMREGYLNLPEDFLRYAADDSKALVAIHDAFVDSMNAVLESMGVDSRFSEDTIPRTFGSCVARALEWKVIHELLSGSSNPDAVTVALFKMGEFNREDLSEKRLLKNYIHLQQELKHLDSADLVGGLTDAELQDIARIPAEFPLLAQQGVKYYSRYTQSTTAFLALVQGGRCVYERYQELSSFITADLDIKGAYAAAMMKLPYCIGRPHLIGNPLGATIRPTLRSFLKSNGDNLVPGGWSLVVEGQLGKHEQDLIFSKLSSHRDIIRCTTNEDGEYDSDEISKIPGEFTLIRGEIINGIITHDILEVLKSVCNQKEWAAFGKLEIVAGQYYLESDRCKTVDEWAEKILSHKGGIGNFEGNRTDSRSFAWYLLPLRGILQPTIDARNHWKRLAKNEAARLEAGVEKSVANARQEFLKLFNNTIYGVFASCYFSVGSTLIGNNITANIRCISWAMSKSFRLHSVITDGGTLTLNNVAFHRTRVLCLSQLSDHYRKSSYESKGSLGGLDWEALFRSGNLPSQDEFDSIATDHFLKYWERYPGALAVLKDVTFEVKYDNFAWAAAFWGKADYAYVPLKNVSAAAYDSGEYPSSSIYFKIRGAKPASKLGADRSPHPKYHILENILRGKCDSPVSTLTYDHTFLQTVSNWRHTNRGSGYESTRSIKPGWEVSTKRLYRINDLNMPVYSRSEFDRKSKRGKKKGTILFERYDNILQIHQRMLMDDLSRRVKPERLREIEEQRIMIGSQIAKNENIA